MNKYEQYEQKCREIRKENKELLIDFKNWLIKKGLQKKTIKKHVSNTEFYINEFLLYDDAIKPEEGFCEIGIFLGYWFIKKAMWANKTAIKENASSLTKFCQFLYEEKGIDKEVLIELKERIKEGLPKWIATMERYDDPDIEDMDDVWEMT